MATKMAIKDVAKVMGLSVAESNRLAKLVPDRLPDVDGKAPKINFKNCLKYSPDFFAETQNPNENVRETMKYAEQLEGNIRNTGVHACGVIISRDPISDWVPVSVAKDSDGQNVLTTQYEGSIIEDTGLIKMDFLGLKTLSIIKEALYNIKITRGIDLDIDHIPLDDKETFELYCNGNTTSTFQFESPGMQQSLRQLKPSKFEDLIAMNALYRPGPMDYIPTFIKRKHGEEEIVYDIPCMKQYLEETYGVTVYQEQVMLLSRLLANFTRGESDMLRKAMGKKQIDKMQKLKKKFMEQGQKNGHAEATLDKIWMDWEKFASYAFNKSHATCYSWVAYQTAYLKAHYPAEYMAGVLSRNLTATDKLKKVMDECRRMGITVKGPDINESMVKFGVNKKGEIRFGLAAVKGVGVNAVNAIISERNANGPYKDIYEFVERVNLSACNRSAIENLAMSGAFDGFNLAREGFVAEAGDSTWSDLLVKYGQNIQNDKNSLQLSLFGDLEPIETNKPPFPQVEPWTRLALLNKEKELVTMYLSAHPLDPYYMELTYGCNTTCDEFKDRELAGQKVTMGGLVTKVTQKMSAKGNPFTIVEIEDFSGKADIRLFGRNHESWGNKFIEGESVYISLNYTQSRYNAERVDLNIDDVTSLESKKGKVANMITIYLDINDKTELLKAVSEIKDTSRPGDLYIDLYDMENRQNIRMHSRKRFPINQELVKLIEEYGVKYKVETYS
jgi:DNA polymerase-3 subunit alpha